MAIQQAAEKDEPSQPTTTLDYEVDSPEKTTDYVPEWTEEEERRIVRKIDFIVMPLLITGLFCLQLDRGNIGNALTDFFFKDVGITQNQFNIGQQLVFVGILIFELPSNIVLYRVGPNIWLGCQFLAWGLVATFQAWQKGVGAFLATRFLLGVCEAGYIPGALYTVTRWYTTGETATRFSWFFVGNMVSAGVSGFMAYGILHMRGVRNMAGWQWLFILEGLLTIVCAFIFFFLFPASPERPRSVLGWRYFTEREIFILNERVLRDDPSKVMKKQHITRREWKNSLTNWRLVLHVLLPLCGLSTSVVFQNYGPTLVVSMGYGRLESNAMLSGIAFGTLIVNVAWGWLADRLGRRGPMVFLGILIYTGFTIGNRVLITSHDGPKRFAILALSSVFSFVWHPVNAAWTALNAQSAGERAVTMATFMMIANVAGIAGSQLFQQQDAPLYRSGWTAIVTLVSVAVVCAAACNLQYWVLNRRLVKNGLEPKYHL